MRCCCCAKEAQPSSREAEPSKLAFKSTSSNFALPKKLLGALPAGQGRRNRLTHT